MTLTAGQRLGMTAADAYALDLGLVNNYFSGPSVCGATRAGRGGR